MLTSEAVSVAKLTGLDVAGVRMALLSYLEPSNLANPSYLVRRLAAPAAAGDDR